MVKLAVDNEDAIMHLLIKSQPLTPIRGELIDLVIKTWVIGQKQHTGRSGREKDYR